VASWYGKRYHGKKTSSGEVYDMYGMSAAHPTLPLPSYAKVTNPANGRFVVVRVNDRGPFKHDRVIDLSYAAAYKLRYSAQGSAAVIVEAIDASNTSAAYIASYTAPSAAAAKATTTPTANPAANPAEAKKVTPVANTTATNSTAINEYFVQAGAFKNEAYADNLLRKIESLEISENAGINKVYNNGLHRLKIGPFDNKLQADSVAADIRKQLNVPAIIVNQ
jgi:rare lipoprotein A